MTQTVYSGLPQGLMVPAWKARTVMVSSLNDLVYLGRESLVFMIAHWESSARFNDIEGTPEKKMQKVDTLRALARMAEMKPPLPQFRSCSWTGIGDELVRAHVNGDLEPYWDPVRVTVLRDSRGISRKPNDCGDCGIIEITPLHDGHNCLVDLWSHCVLKAWELKYLRLHPEFALFWATYGAGVENLNFNDRCDAENALKYLDRSVPILSPV